MNGKRFEEIFAETVSLSEEVLVNKAREYADDVDRLRNFKHAAHLQSIKPRVALGGMMSKHTVSVYDIIGSEKLPAIEVVDEKIIDHINYLILLRAQIIEELEGKVK